MVGKDNDRLKKKLRVTQTMHHHHGHEHSHSVQHSQQGADGGMSEKGAQMMRRVTLLAVTVASVLLLSKLYAWLLSDSLSLLSSLVDSAFDVLVSLMNMFAVRYALKPADDDHRFGHTSIEDIVGLAQFAFICGSMVFIIVQSIQRLISPVEIAHTTLGIGIMSLSIVLTAGLLLAQRYVYRQTGSLIIHADALHYLTDLLMNLSIIGSLILVKYLDWYWADSVLAMAIAFYVLHHTFGIGKRAFDNLMDKEMPDHAKEKILSIIERQPEVKGFHNLKTRYSGAKPFIQMHLDLDGSHTLRQTHDVADRLERTLQEAFPGAEVIIHQDPV